MGIETILLLVDSSSLEKLLDKSWSEVYSGMEATSFREFRPQQDSRLKTVFAIDCEAELLDWMDANSPQDCDSSIVDALKAVKDGEEGLLHLMRYCSVGAWEVWEARALLYLDNATGKPVEHIDDLYAGWTWQEVTDRLNGTPEEEFSEKVTLDWMSRREALGETLDENLDAKIIPTFEAHSRAAKDLVYAITRICEEENLVAIIGREHLPAAKWGHDEWNLATYLHSL